MRSAPFYFLIALCAFAGGCVGIGKPLLYFNDPKVELSASDAEMAQRILEVVPVGTPLKDARELMEKQGFRVWGVEDWDAPAYRGTALRCSGIYQRWAQGTKIYVFFSFDGQGITGATVHRSYIRY